jgi:hypothetical protein
MSSRVQDVDEDGARMLVRGTGQGPAQRTRCCDGQRQALRDLLTPRIMPGKAELPAQWLLYLETLQQLGDEAAFEEFAIQYAVTFEQSPPSWDARWVSAALVPPAAPAPQPKSAKAPVALLGEITGAKQDAFAVLMAGDTPAGRAQGRMLRSETHGFHQCRSAVQRDHRRAGHRPPAALRRGAADGCGAVRADRGGGGRRNPAASLLRRFPRRSPAVGHGTPYVTSGHRQASGRG